MSRKLAIKKNINFENKTEVSHVQLINLAL